MALIPIYHVVPSYYDVDPNYDAVTNPIKMGMFVSLNSSTGYVQIAQNRTDAIGIAGDSLASDQGYTPFAADLIVSGTGATRSTSNRVSDFFDETKGSGKLTVYHSGGEFLTDQYVDGQSWTVGGSVYVGTGASSNKGKLSADSTNSATAVGRLITGPGDYPSGVPGTDVSGSISLGIYVRFKLSL